MLFLILPLANGQTDSNKTWNTYDAYQKKVRSSDSSKRRDTGMVNVHQPALLDSLIARYRRSKREYPGLEGFRVQLFFGEREKAEKMRADFKKKYSAVDAYIDYLAPNFRLRVGDFRTRIAAYRFMQGLDKEFGRPYIVSTRIDLPELGIEELNKKKE